MWLEATAGPGRAPQRSRNDSLLRPLKLEVDPNIQAVGTQEKIIKTLLNGFASYIMDKVQKLEQQNKTLEPKWSVLQQQEMVQSDMDNTRSASSATLGRCWTQ